MTLNLMRIEAALNAYPWTPGTLTTRERDARYCAVGIMLRYAGVAREHIGCAVMWDSRRLWSLYGGLLRAEYGVPDEQAMIAIMAANDSSQSHAEAIDRVRRVLSGTLDPFVPRAPGDAGEVEEGDGQLVSSGIA